MLLTNILIIAAIAAVLIIVLVIYGLLSKDKTPMMGNGCHGDCAHCALGCEDEKKQD